MVQYRIEGNKLHSRIVTARNEEPCLGNSPDIHLLSAIHNTAKSRDVQAGFLLVKTRFFTCVTLASRGVTWYMMRH